MIKISILKKALFAPLLFTGIMAGAQQITLDECYTLARQNYPLSRKAALLKESSGYNIHNAAKAFLPQVSIGGQATYQTEVTSFPVKIPNMSIPELSKDQYRIQAEVSQLIYDGGMVKSQQELIKANEAVQLQQTEVSLNSLKERVAQLYFAVLLYDAQLNQRQLLKENLNAAIAKANAALKNGTTYKSTVTELQAEILNTDATDTEIRLDRKGYITMLSQLIGKPIDEQTHFVKPAATPANAPIARPELHLFDLQKKVFDSQEKKLRSDWMPKISAFAQGGYGRPGLNMLKDEFRPFAIGGIRFTLPLSGLYTYKNNKALLENSRRQVELERETFLLNTKMALDKENADMQKYRELIKKDDEIIALRESVAKAARAQLDNGVITTSDYINKLNAENLARQMKNLHEIQLQKALHNFQNINGN